MGVFNKEELCERIELNYARLTNDPYYRIEGVYSPSDYEWYGDKEGRALLAFVSHYKINNRRIPCMDQLMATIGDHLNEKMFFGPIPEGTIHEQQLSGHSWLLRGLCEYYEQFEDEFALKMLTSIYKNLYLPTKNKYSTYPINRAGESGGVSGSTVGENDGWKLSSDVGCAFMSIDGLSHAYAVLGDNEMRELIDEMIDVYLAIDKKALKVQTHCTLTAARGMMRMYERTEEKKYLDGARSIYELYTEGGGMTYTYQNVNWWGRDDTWTEPCAIVDSLMLACQLYYAEGDEKYKRTAARIYHNGLASAQRINGGAGTDTVVTKDGMDTLYSKMYEAYFCCTMRLAEGLWYINENSELLHPETTGSVTRQENGTYMDGDILYAEIEGADKYLMGVGVTVDSHTLHPLLKYYKIDRDDMDSIKQKIVF